ncbi:glycerophosphoryl diester phosphodiesterase family protein [Isoptericola sp. CG 20/1183]|uniref:Glycerophosphoryl diester phosphodiesterase family protein n=1 Tax=Isoptericola halotolerans TaxID=300560 RepID=A0ABX5EFR2_9MICO|nr:MULTISPECIES: glycerophosphoryl diester phosphodiesterase membrane domain-containing protein [Isoptericola]PRZ04910.1 glycerophosphoryl diester phosphodiesterase family protein [Isoptericola halotolerans]PRZ05401.1 glycerophosphoryl diester phosphodiesterase family protein [Isoptericola sp. CG 20/1183]
MSTPDQPTPPSGWGEAPRPPAYGQYGPGQYGSGRYGPGEPAPDGGASAQGTPRPGPAPSDPYGPSATKPGVVPLRPLSLGEIFDGAFSSVRHNPAVMLGLVAVVVAAATLLAALLAQFAVPALTGLFSEAASVDAELEYLTADAGWLAQLMAVSGALSLTLLIAQPITEGFITASVSQSVIGRKLSVGEVWAKVRPRLAVLIGWMLLRTVGLGIGLAGVFVGAVLLVSAVAVATDSVGLSVLVGLLCLVAIVVLAAWVWVRLMLVAPALVLEGSGLGRTIARAWRLTRGAYWRVFGTVLLASIIASVAGQVVAYPLSLLGLLVDGSDFGWGLILSSVVASVVASMVYLVFVSAVVALVYTDVRMRREGLDVQLAAAAERAAQQTSDGHGSPAGSPGTPPPGGSPQW